ncbi:MAG: hypothetical protein WC254_01650 [Candidatus Woesearchaeota archaeon]
MVQELYTKPLMLGELYYLSLIRSNGLDGAVGILESKLKDESEEGSRLAQLLRQEFTLDNLDLPDELVDLTNAYTRENTETIVRDNFGSEYEYWNAWYQALQPSQTLKKGSDCKGFAVLSVVCDRLQSVPSRLYPINDNHLITQRYIDDQWAGIDPRAVIGAGIEIPIIISENQEYNRAYEKALTLLHSK